MKPTADSARGSAAALRPALRGASWAAVVAATTRHFGKLDVLVNNAGISGRVGNARVETRP